MKSYISLRVFGTENINIIVGIAGLLGWPAVLEQYDPD
jgi:hypothetical protein